MLNAKVIANDGVDVKLGFSDGTFHTAKAMELAFAAPVGTVVDVYKSEEGGEYLYAEHTAGSNGSGFSAAGDKGGEVLGRIKDEVFGGHKTGKTAYILLAFFLGGTGLHKFYAHKYILGIIYALFCWTFIPSFIAFIEAIIAIFRKADENGQIEV